jgi:dipeptidyl aminopeptidase/acylaminoacyl peptidase
MLRLFFSATLFIAGTAFAQPAAPPAPATPAVQPATDPALLFGTRESVEQMDISPDGRRLVYLQPGPGRTTLVFLHDLGRADATPIVVTRSSGSPERMLWCRFATNDRLICQARGMTEVEGMLVPFSRLISMNADGSDGKLLGQRQSYNDARLRQFDGAILDWSGGEAGSVLMARELIPEAGMTGSRTGRTADGLAVERIDVRTLRTSRIEPPNDRVSHYISDGRGNVRIMAIPARRSGDQMGTSVAYSYRAAGSRDWHPLGSYDSVTGEGMIPLAVDPDLNVAFVLKKLNGRMALYRVKLDATLATELAYANEQVDVDDVVTANRGSKVIGVTFADEQRRIVYFDPAFAAVHRMLGRAIPNLPLIDFGGTSADGNLVVVHAGSDADPGRYYIFNRATRNLNEIMLARPQLENVPLANVRSVTYPAADGTPVPAYLTLPPGREARGLPTVILPHGGPAARDEWGFDWLAQYLAHQGYAVLQPNYRGSAGYGDAWLKQNGFQGWRTSIGDINAGARWLAAQGIGDPRRMAILGWSYGGYAALQAGVTEPGLFRAIVAIAPVTDLQQAKDDFRNYTSARNQADYIGSGPHIREGSPLQNVSAITAPVLLFHGDRDLNVPIVHSRRMDAALRGAGKRSELVAFPGLEHDLADSAVRTQMLQRVGTFLQTNLAPRP